MSRLIQILVFFFFPILVFANPIANEHEDDKKKRKKSTSEIRAQRQIAITLDGGWNTVGANGIMASYYLTPRFGIDAGFGSGVKGPKIGVRGKCMLSTENFAPFMGLGISGRFLKSDGRIFENDNNGAVLVLDIKNVVYIQPAIGFEYMSSEGFVIGLATGYTIAANKPYEVVSGRDKSLETGFDLLWGNGIILSANIGYAF